MKKSDIVKLVVGIVIMFVVILSASYAYFSNARVSVNTNISNDNANITLNITNTATLSLTATTYNPLTETMIATTTVKNVDLLFFNGSSNYVTCNYDIVYLPDPTTDVFESSPGNIDNEQELVITGSFLSQESFSYDLTNKPYVDDKGYKIMTATVESDSGIGVGGRWEFRMIYYNRDFDQSINAGKNIKGQIVFRPKGCFNYPTAHHIITSLQGTSNVDSNNLPWTVKWEDGYRYEGKNPNNYICFKQSCDSSSLFRIVGILPDEALEGDSTLYTSNLLKVVKNTYYNASAYGTSTSGDWLTSPIRTTLNTTYLSNSDVSDIKDKILTTKWYLMSNSSWAQTPAATFDFERDGTVYPGRKKYVFDKMGLIYGSDFLYGSYETGSCSHSNAYSSAYATNCKGSNYLLPGANSWAINPTAGTVNKARYYTSSGVTNSATVTGNYRYNPAFHLSGDVILSGSGTASDPYKLVS